VVGEIFEGELAENVVTAEADDERVARALITDF
jgi:hypothetical protein